MKQKDRKNKKSLYVYTENGYQEFKSGILYKKKEIYKLWTLSKIW